MLGRVIRGKSDEIDVVLVGILGGGHVLLEDVPGVGKTTLAKALARVLGMGFARVQFTPDLLPADILGTNLLDPRDGSFQFRLGPIFHHILLADEINRASPRTQAALLEAMNEGQVTVDGTTRRLPTPFFVLATQNPVDYQGTYPLPEAELDRFMVRVSLGYPDAARELEILFDRREGDPLETLVAEVRDEEVLELQKDVRRVNLSEDVGRYLLEIIRATRNHEDLVLGASPRGSLALFRASQAFALIHQREWVGPHDVQAMVQKVLSHRVMMSNQAKYSGKTEHNILQEIVEKTKVPK